VAAASEIELTLSIRQNSYGLNDEILLKVGYKNISKHPVTVLPQTELYPTDVVELRYGGKAKPAKVLEYFEVGIDFARLIKYAVVLQPQESCHRTIMARFASSLPRYFNDSRRGLFLVFKGSSAFELPGSGEYAVVAKYVSSVDNPVKQYLPRAAPPLWEGKVKSRSVKITFRADQQR
jgi:hypothetical protein